MALDDRADAVTTVDDDADDPAAPSFGRSPAGSVARQGSGGVELGESGPSSNGSHNGEVAKSDRALDDHAPDPGDPSASAPAGNGAPGPDRASGRQTRKRTTRQRALLMAETAVASDPDVLEGDAAGGVDPLLAIVPSADAVEIDEAQARTGVDRHPTATPAIVPAATASTAATPLTARYAPSPMPTAPIPVPITRPALAPVVEEQPDAATVTTPPVTIVPPPPLPRRRARPRVRKVTRVVRSVDAWSVFKVAALFFVAMGVVLMTAAVLLWNLAQSTGTLDNVEGFLREAFNYDTFQLQSEPLFRAFLTLTVLFVVAGTGLTVVMAVLFNLIADLTGGIRLTVLEREVVARDDVRRKRRGRRRQPRPAAPPAVSPLASDPDGPGAMPPLKGS